MRQKRENNFTCRRTKLSVYSSVFPGGEESIYSSGTTINSRVSAPLRTATFRVWLPSRKRKMSCTDDTDWPLIWVITSPGLKPPLINEQSQLNICEPNSIGTINEKNIKIVSLVRWWSDGNFDNEHALNVVRQRYHVALGHLVPQLGRNSDHGNSNVPLGLCLTPVRPALGIGLFNILSEKFLGIVDWNRKWNASSDFHGVDADHFTVQVHQWPTGVSKLTTTNIK